MSNPLVDRILSNPLSFVTAKYADTHDDQPASYIVLSKKSRPSAAPAPKMVAIEKRPKSMAEAIAAYTGKRYLTKAEKKRQTPKKEEESSDTQYESALEFHTDSSFQGFRSSSEEKTESKGLESKSESSSEEAITPVVGNDADDSDDSGNESESESLSDDSESESAGEEAPKMLTAAETSTALNLDQDDSDDDDDEDHQGQSSDSASSSEDDEDNDDDANASGNGEMTRDELLQLKHDLLNDRTPPTSPDDEEKPAASSPATPNKITKTWGTPYMGRRPVGLLNFGVTCYMNLAIQLMVHIPAVQHYLHQVQAGKVALKPRSVTHTLAELAGRMWGTEQKGSRKFVNPKKMVQRLHDINCMMSEWQQEDSHEYFMSLMARLQEDSTPKGRKLNELVMYDIFGGLLHQEVICQTCHTVSKTKQEFYDLSLGLNKKRRTDDGRYAVEKSIHDFFSTETIRIDLADESSGYHCEKCKKRTVATKKSTIDRSPDTLMVHMKRFKFNGNASSKVKQPIAYLKHLDLTPYTTTPESSHYLLIAVIVHEGRSISLGHYVAHCLQPDGGWATYDDEYINKIDERAALSDPLAYCLVYTKDVPRRKRQQEEGKGTAKRAKL